MTQVEQFEPRTGEPQEAAPDLREQVIRIAIAEDQPLIREALRARLSLEPDFEIVAEVRDGFEVLDMLPRAEPDILLLDLNMPELDGLATLRRLPAYRLKTRTIVLTASEDKSKHIQAMRFGASGVVSKQTSTELLVKSIRKVFGGEIWLDRRTTAALIKRFTSSGRPPAQARPGNWVSGREVDILRLAGQGLKNREIAEKLLISEQTVRNYVHSLFRKLGFSERWELVRYVMQRKARLPRAGNKWEAPEEQ